MSTRTDEYPDEVGVSNAAYENDHDDEGDREARTARPYQRFTEADADGNVRLRAAVLAEPAADAEQRRPTGCGHSGDNTLCPACRRLRRRRVHGRSTRAQ